ncbi:hypothetical protein LTR85_002465 [Meristemomyces frigidus]|nr:hypothetical protein LTR85_002465 [Meristemomyces frigidus]
MRVNTGKAPPRILAAQVANAHPVMPPRQPVRAAPRAQPAIPPPNAAAAPRAHPAMPPRKPVASAAAAPPAPAPPPTRRSARLQQAAAGPLPDPKTRITKPTPTPKPKPSKYTCTTCDRHLATSSFPNHLPTDNCAHLINTCKSCTKTHIAAQLDTTTYDKLACPECAEVMGNADVETLAGREVWERFDALERRGVAEKVPGWRWCLNAKCRGGQVHPGVVGGGEEGWAVDAGEAGDKNKGEGEGEGDDDEGKAGKQSSGEQGKAKKAEDDVNEAGTKTKTRSKKKSTAVSSSSSSSSDNDDTICTCTTCGARACVPCDRPYHDGETCAQYQKRRARQTTAEEQATAKTIEAKCKKCPNAACGKNIEKNGGCDAVYCVCGEHFCWPCRTPYLVINKQGHGEGCVYAEAGRFDPHAMPQAPGNAAFGGMLN